SVGYGCGKIKLHGYKPVSLHSADLPFAAHIKLACMACEDRADCRRQTITRVIAHKTLQGDSHNSTLTPQPQIALTIFCYRTGRINRQVHEVRLRIVAIE